MSSQRKLPLLRVLRHQSQVLHHKLRFVSVASLALLKGSVRRGHGTLLTVWATAVGTTAGTRCKGLDFINFFRHVRARFWRVMIVTGFKARKSFSPMPEFVEVWSRRALINGAGFARNPIGSVHRLNTDLRLAFVYPQFGLAIRRKPIKAVVLRMAEPNYG